MASIRGRQLHGGKFDLGDIWTRRAIVLNDSDSIKQMKFTPDRDIDFVFMLVYSPDSLNENKLLFEMARFNFTNFLVRNFEIQIEEVGGMRQMRLTGFLNFEGGLRVCASALRQPGRRTTDQRQGGTDHH